MLNLFKKLKSMCKNVVLFVAPSMTKKEEIEYQRLVKEKTLDGEKGRKIIFVFGQNSLNLNRSSIVKKVIFDIAGKSNEEKIIAEVKNTIVRINKGNIPIYLRLGNDNREFGCTKILSLRHVQHFNPIEVPC